MKRYSFNAILDNGKTASAIAYAKTINKAIASIHENMSLLIGDNEVVDWRVYEVSNMASEEGIGSRLNQEKKKALRQPKSNT